MVVRLVFSNGPLTEEPAQEYFVGYIADHYYQTWKAESQGFLAILMEYPELARAVHRRLARASDFKEDDLTDFKEKFEEKFEGQEEPLFLPAD